MSISTKPSPSSEDVELKARRQRAMTGEASSGLWQRTSFRRAIIEGIIIFCIWRLLELVPIEIWPSGIFPFILIFLLLLRFTPPVWSSMRIIATKREKMSRRFFLLSGILATSCAISDLVITLFIGEAQQPFGGPLYGPDIARFAAHAHHLAVTTFMGDMLKSWVFLLAYYLIAVICTRLAQGGFLRFTMPAGDGRVTL
jgi:hypothetical protein